MSHAKRIRILPIIIFIMIVLAGSSLAESTFSSAKTRQVRIKGGTTYKLPKKASHIVIKNKKILRLLKNNKLKALKKGKSKVTYVYKGRKVSINVVVYRYCNNKPQASPEIQPEPVETPIQTPINAPINTPAQTSAPTSPAPTSTPWGTIVYPYTPEKKEEYANIPDIKVLKDTSLWFKLDNQKITRDTTILKGTRTKCPWLKIEVFVNDEKRTEYKCVNDYFIDYFEFQVDFSDCKAGDGVKLYNDPFTNVYIVSE